MPAYNIVDAKVELAQLVQRAVSGEDVVIGEAGTPMVRLVPLESEPRQGRREFGKNLLGITFLADDWEQPMWTDDELRDLGLA